MKRSTLVLAIIFFVEFLLLVILKNTGQIGLKAVEIQENYLELDSLAIAKLEIRPTFGEQITIELQDSIWYITNPIKAKRC